jgi:hypothetical protein
MGTLACASYTLVDRRRLACAISLFSSNLSASLHVSMLVWHRPRRPRPAFSIAGVEALLSVRFLIFAPHPLLNSVRFSR